MKRGEDSLKGCCYTGTFSFEGSDGSYVERAVASFRYYNGCWHFFDAFYGRVQSRIGPSEP